MPRPDAAHLIGENLHNLPAADGKPRRLLTFSKIGHAPALQNQITQRALDLGECIVHLLETHGYSIVHRTDPEPGDVDPGKAPKAIGHCSHCATPVLTLQHLKSDPTEPGVFRAKLHRSTIERAGLTHACWGTTDDNATTQSHAPLDVAELPTLNSDAETE